MPAPEEARSVWLHFFLFKSVRFQMSLQIACLSGCILTFDAFVGLFSTVRFKMCPHVACLRGYKITLVACERERGTGVNKSSLGACLLFSTVRFQI